MGDLEILQTPLFLKQKKKLKKIQIQDLDKAVKSIRRNPQIGFQKMGDLEDIWVYKFSMAKQQCLLAYQWDEKSRKLLALGVHENFYRDLKRNIK